VSPDGVAEQFPVASGSGSWIGLFYAANAYNCSLSGAGYRDRIGLQPPAAGCILTIVRLQGPGLVRQQERHRNREAVQA